MIVILSATLPEDLLAQVEAVVPVLVVPAGTRPTRGRVQVRSSCEHRYAVHSHRQCDAAARPGLKALHGCIVTNASMLGFFGGDLLPAYNGCKGAAQHSIKLSIAYASDQIRVNGGAQDRTVSPRAQALQGDARCPTPQVLACIPIDRWDTPDDVADPVPFSASDAFCFVTGVTSLADGGFLNA